MKDLMDYPLTVSRIQKDYPGFEFSSDVQEQNSLLHLRPVLSWLNAQGIVINIQEKYSKVLSKLRNRQAYLGTIEQRGRIETSFSESKIEVTKEAIMISFRLLEARYLKQLLS